MKRIRDVRESGEYRDPPSPFIRGESSGMVHMSDGRAFGAVFDFKVRPNWPEELAEGRAALIPRLLYLLADRTGRPLPRRWARRLDRRLVPFYEAARRQTAMYERFAASMKRTYSGTFKINYVSPKWVEGLLGYFNELGYQARVTQRRIEHLSQVLEIAQAKGVVFGNPPESRAWWQWLWRWMKLEAKAGYRDATGYWTVTR